MDMDLNRNIALFNPTQIDDFYVAIRDRRRGTKCEEVVAAFLYWQERPFHIEEPMWGWMTILLPVGFGLSYSAIVNINVEFPGQATRIDPSRSVTLYTNDQRIELAYRLVREGVCPLEKH